MGIWSKLGTNIFSFLDEKVGDSKIKTVVTGAAASAALKELALYIAVSYIAGTISKCDFLVYGDDEEDRKSLEYLLNVSPNANQSASQFKTAIIENYFYGGHALVVPRKESLYVADSFAMESNGLNPDKFSGVVVNNYEIPSRLKASDVCYFRMESWDVKQLVDSMYADYGNVFAYAIQAYRNANGKKYKLELESYKAGDAEFNKIYETVIKEQLKTFLENDTAVYPQYQGMNLEEFSRPGGKAQLNCSDIISMRKEIFELAAQATKVPWAMLTGNITSINDVVKSYLSFCIDPLAAMISEELTRKLFKYPEWLKGWRVKVDTSCINHLDILEVADKADKLISSGVASIDEVRKLLGMNLLNTSFSQGHYMTKNYEAAESNLEGKEDA